MNKLLLFIYLMLVMLSSLLAQKLDSATLASPQKLHDFYWERSKHKAKTGWILLGSGLAATVGGLFLLGQAINDYPSIDVGPGVALGVGGAGLASTLTSLGFFASSADDKVKAKFALQVKKVAFGNTSLPKSIYPALSFTIPL